MATKKEDRVPDSEEPTTPLSSAFGWKLILYAFVLPLVIVFLAEVFIF